MYYDPTRSPGFMGERQPAPAIGHQTWLAGKKPPCMDDFPSQKPLKPPLKHGISQPCLMTPKGKQSENPNESHQFWEILPSDLTMA